MTAAERANVIQLIQRAITTTSESKRQRLIERIARQVAKDANFSAKVVLK